jgi:7,8-dihydropterin-6-yl-methyl-4-(beta-D-ribofuranosyl)aminobenzene 5'-phosphate synthase
MKVTIIYDNEAFNEDLTADWGFAALIEDHGSKILFDTGADGPILLDNMKKLKISPNDFHDVFISHDHWDHRGGLKNLLELNRATLYIPASYRVPDGAGKIVTCSQPVEIADNIFSTGELDKIEHSMVIKTDKGPVVIVGCSHPGVSEILDAASQYGKVRGIIGGLHGFSDFDLVENLEFICPTHCTQHIVRIKLSYPGKYIGGGAGKVIEI